MTQDSTSFGVRRATPSDSAVLMDVVPLILAETSVLPLSDLKIEALVERCACQVGGAIAGIIDGPDGLINATIGLAFAESDISDEPYIEVKWCGINPSMPRVPLHQHDDPRKHYGRRLFEFARWCHGALETAAGRNILVLFDLSTIEFLLPKIGLYQRNLTQIGATFALGAVGSFKDIPALPAEIIPAPAVVAELAAV